MSRQFTGYEEQGVYHGCGTVWSETLKFAITGRFRVTWSDRGGCRIDCFETNLSMPQSIAILQDFSEFRGLKIQCEEAAFQAARCYRAYTDESDGLESNQADISFTTLEAEYIASSERVF